MPGVEPSQQIEQRSKTPELDASLVMVPAIVTGVDGKYVSDLRTAEFHVFADNVEQRIEKVIPPADPMDTILMLDTSPSTRSALDEMQRWALAFIDALRPQDRLMAVTFDNQVFVLSDFTGDRDKLRGALFKVRQGGNTRLYDALNLVGADRQPTVTGRRTMVLFTDGVDTSSRLVDAADALGNIERSNMPVFVVRFDAKAEQKTARSQLQRRPIIVPDGVLDSSPLYAFADQYLSSLVEESGGQIYLAKANDSSDGPVPFILDALRHQYNLCFHPAETTRGGSLHNIRVTIDRPGVTIRARARYRPALPAKSRYPQ
jgi:VWFA-related protein